MCSILAILDLRSPAAELRPRALEMSRKMRHRGPDWSGVFSCDTAILAHERLAIVDVRNGAQPLYGRDGRVVLAVNGEIYNHRELRAEYAADYPFTTESDCEIILALYEKMGADFLDLLNGIFAFVLYDQDADTYLIGRDHIGIIPLYQGVDEKGTRYVASELKALVPGCAHVEDFPPGHYFRKGDTAPTRYYERDWMRYDAVKDNPASVADVRVALESAVKRQLMSDVPYGVLLSGGLDSSVISAITKKYVQRRIEDEEKSEAWWPQLHSFAIGLEGAPDLIAARKVADHLGTVHHEIHYTVQEGLDAVRDVVYHLETYDVTTIRASTPMYLMARYVKAMGIKMVLSGEGSDEAFGGYLYFHKAPDARALHEETVRKLSKLHQFDCLRANKSMASWGVEARVPFLDKEVLDVVMRLGPEAKMCRDGRIEKQILREAFAHYLPEEVTWRQKEQFSDGVGYLWIDSLKAKADETVTDEMMETAALRFPVNTPDTKEAYFYRDMFEDHFPLRAAAECVPFGKSVACSSPVAVEWDRKFAESADPSGRAVRGVHRDAYE